MSYRTKKHTLYVLIGLMFTIFTWLGLMGVGLYYLVLGLPYWGSILHTNVIVLHLCLTAAFGTVYFYQNEVLEVITTGIHDTLDIWHPGWSIEVTDIYPSSQRDTYMKNRGFSSDGCTFTLKGLNSNTATGVLRTLEDVSSQDNETTSYSLVISHEPTGTRFSVEDGTKYYYVSLRNPKGQKKAV